MPNSSAAYLIYGLYHPRRPKIIRYVGKARHAQRRLFQHVSDAFGESPDNIYLAEWLRDLVKAGIVPAVRVLERVSADDSWEEREQYWIARYSTPHLFNIRTGGHNGVWRIRTEDASTRLADNAREQGKKNRGRVWVNNGTRNIWVHPGAIPEGFERGRLQRSVLPERNRGSIWITDGKNNRQLRPGEAMPEFYRPGRVIWRGYKASLAYKHGSGWRGSIWITNGTETRRLHGGEAIPEGWRQGRHNMQWITNGTKTRRLMPGESLPNGWWHGRKLKPAREERVRITPEAGEET